MPAKPSFEVINANIDSLEPDNSVSGKIQLRVISDLFKICIIHVSKFVLYM